MLDSRDTGGRSRQACTALAEGCPASVLHREVVLTDNNLCYVVCGRYLVHMGQLTLTLTLET